METDRLTAKIKRKMATTSLEDPVWGDMMASFIKKWKRHPVDCQCVTYCRPDRRPPRRRDRK